MVKQPGKPFARDCETLFLNFIVNPCAGDGKGTEGEVGPVV